MQLASLRETQIKVARWVASKLTQTESSGTAPRWRQCGEEKPRSDRVRHFVYICKIYLSGDFTTSRKIANACTLCVNSFLGI